MNDKKQSQKRVRLSFVNRSTSSRASHNESELQSDRFDNETVADFIVKNSSRRSSISSSTTSRRVSRIPSVLLNNLNDHKLLIQHVSNLKKLFIKLNSYHTLNFIEYKYNRG